jgi:hypothetical protein
VGQTVFLPISEYTGQLPNKPVASGITPSKPTGPMTPVPSNSADPTPIRMYLSFWPTFFSIQLTLIKLPPPH